MTERRVHRGQWVEVEDGHTGPISENDVTAVLAKGGFAKSPVSGSLAPEPSDDETGEGDQAEVIEDPEGQGLTPPEGDPDQVDPEGDPDQVDDPADTPTP